VALWWWLRRRAADGRLRRAVGAVCVLLGIQGAVGLVQYYTELPAELVWVHVSLATVTWVAILWAVACAGRPAPVAAVTEASRRLAPDQPRLRQPA
jgi:cytochrome c oxidase assembly protein subunit 15